MTKVNDALKQFIANLGIICETWTIVYKNFISQGMNEKEAMTHTQGVMTSIITSTTQNNGGNQ